MPYYPTDEPGRLILAAELTRRGYRPTQDIQDFSRDKIEVMASAMCNGTFDWLRASLQPIILGPNGEVLGGHHRIVSAHLAGVDVLAVSGPRPQQYRVNVCYRPTRDWMDALPATI